MLRTLIRCALVFAIFVIPPSAGCRLGRVTVASYVWGAASSARASRVTQNVGRIVGWSRHSTG
jgi:hypothetical protein